MISDDSYILAHISDLHLAFPEHVRLVDLLNKRFFGYMSWRLRRSAEHHSDVLANLIEDFKANQPDHIVVTGDLTHLGLPAELLKAKELLNALGPPSQITVIPGNHDAYVPGALDQCLTHWIDYIVSDQTEMNPDESISDVLFPILRIRDGVAIIGVSTARPCSIFWAVGCIGDGQLKRLQNILIETRQRGLFRIVLIHHPPVSGIVSWRKRLTDAEAFQRALQDCGAELILHGHSHHQSQTYLETSGGRIPVIGIPSVSASGENPKRRARYHLYRLLSRSDSWDIRVCVRSYANQKKRFETEDEYQLTV